MRAWRRALQHLPRHDEAVVQVVFVVVHRPAAGEAPQHRHAAGGAGSAGGCRTAVRVRAEGAVPASGGGADVTSVAPELGGGAGGGPGGDGPVGSAGGDGLAVGRAVGRAGAGLVSGTVVPFAWGND